MNLMRTYGSNARLRLSITSHHQNIFRAFKSLKNNFQVANSSPSSASSRLTFLIQRLWKRTFMGIVNGDSIPIGSKILADKRSLGYWERSCVRSQVREVISKAILNHIPDQSLYLDKLFCLNTAASSHNLFTFLALEEFSHWVG